MYRCLNSTYPTLRLQGLTFCMTSVVLSPQLQGKGQSTPIVSAEIVHILSGLEVSFGCKVDGPWAPERMILHQMILMMTAVFSFGPSTSATKDFIQNKIFEDFLETKDLPSHGKSLPSQTKSVVVLWECLPIVTHVRANARGSPSQAPSHELSNLVVDILLNLSRAKCFHGLGHLALTCFWGTVSNISKCY